MWLNWHGIRRFKKGDPFTPELVQALFDDMALRSLLKSKLNGLDGSLEAHVAVSHFGRERFLTLIKRAPPWRAAKLRKALDMSKRFRVCRCGGRHLLRPPHAPT